MLMRVFAVLAVLLSTTAAQAATCTVPSYNTFYTIPANHTAAEAFKGKFDYPATTSEPLPGFLSIDYNALCRIERVTGWAITTWSAGTPR